MRHRNVVLSLGEVADARDETLTTLFSLSNSAVLAQFSAECLRGMENAQPEIRVRHSGPVTQKSLLLIAAVTIVPFPTILPGSTLTAIQKGGLKILYPDFRVAVLNSLGQKGLIGIYDFMRGTMISLMPAGNGTTSSRIV